MSWSTHLRSAQDFVKVGDEVEAVVLTLDKEERKMSLGIKQLTQDPWTDITIKYPLGSKHSGIVRNYTTFGVFVELEEGIDGLIYISDLSWTKKVKHPSEIVTVGQKLDVIVLELDVDGRKLSLGHKQTTDNPWEKYSETYSEGSIHELSITDIVDKGATIKLNEDINAFVPRRHMEKQDGQKLSKGEKAEFKVIEFSKDFKRIVMSHSAVFKGIEADNIKKNNLKNKESVEKSTLGDIDALADLKSKMDKG
jgi:small subunit ribosomal protein S1